MRSPAPPGCVSALRRTRLESASKDGWCATDVLPRREEHSAEGLIPEDIGIRVRLEVLSGGVLAACGQDHPYLGRGGGPAVRQTSDFAWRSLEVHGSAT